MTDTQSSAATEHATRRNPEMEKFVQITPVVMEGYPDACNVWLKVENQKFMVSPHSCETRGEAEWLRDMLCIALARIAADSLPSAAQAAINPTKWLRDLEVRAVNFSIKWGAGGSHAKMMAAFAGQEIAAQPPAAPVETKPDWCEIGADGWLTLKHSSAETGETHTDRENSSTFASDITDREMNRGQP